MKKIFLVAMIVAASVVYAQTTVNGSGTVVSGVLPPGVTSDNNKGLKVEGSLTVGTKVLTPNLPRVLNFQKSSTAITGNGAAQVVYTFTIPANTLPASSGIKATVIWAHSGTNSVTYTWSFGSYTANLAASTSQFTFNTDSIVIVADPGSTTAQNVIVNPPILGTGIIGGATVATTAQNYAQDIVVSFSFNVASPDTVTPKAFIVEYVPPAT